MGTLPLANTQDASDWQIRAYDLPFPEGASVELRKSIASTPQPDVARRQAREPKNLQGWKDAISTRAKDNLVGISQVENAFDVVIKESKVSGVRVYEVTPKQIAPSHANHIMLYVHGGAYVFGAGTASLYEASVIASTSRLKVLSVDYRMPPEDPFPQAIEDAVAVYRFLLKSYEPSEVAFGGTSAGGGLALATTHRLKALDVALPGAIYAGTPWADLSKTGDTLFTNEGLDRVLVSYEGLLKGAAELYADGESLKDPLISPIYGDFDSFPPTIFVSGTRDMLLSDTARTHQKIRAAGGVADLLVFEALSHAGYLRDLESPESRQTYDQISLFLKEHLR